MRRGEEDASTSLLFAPAFVDLQVNGQFGTDFSSPPSLSLESLRRVAQALWKQGVAYFFPTIVTGSFESTRQSLELIAALAKDTVLAGSLPGIHLEGPYIAAEDGPRGAHPRAHVRPPSQREFAAWQEAAGGMIRLMTLAPELPGAPPFIRALRAEGVLIAIGHTDAGAEDIKNAVTAGAMLSTHLGNATHALLRRHPNYLWEQLAEDGLWASLIVDGHHLPPSVVKAMVRAKGAERCLLISDAAAVAGLPAERYVFAGADIELTSEGSVRLAGTDYLAGSALQLPEAIHNVAMFAGLDQAVALDMASHHPSLLLRLATPLSLEVFSHKTFTLLNWSEEGLSVKATVVGGSVRHLSKDLCGEEPTERFGRIDDT